MAKKLAQDTLLSTIEATQYVGIARNTLKRHERNGIIVPGTTDPSNPDRKFWYVRDLDQLKMGMEGYKGKRGKKFLAIGASTELKEQSLARQATLEAGLMEMSNVPPNFTLQQGQNLIRYQLLEMARRNKVISRLFALLDSPDGKIQLAAIEKILNKILPDLKSIEQVHTVDETTAKRQERTLQALEMIKTHLQGTTTTIEGEYLILPEITPSRPLLGA